MFSVCCNECTLNQLRFYIQYNISIVGLILFIKCLKNQDSARLKGFRIRKWAKLDHSLSYNNSYMTLEVYRI